MSEAIILTSIPEKKGKKVRLLNKLLWFLIVILFTIVIFELVFWIIIAPRLVIKHIDIRGDFAISRNELLSIAGIKGKEYYFSINCDDIRMRLTDYPIIKDAEVVKIFPDTLRIAVNNRRPLAISFGAVDQKTIPVAFDTEGIIFQIGKSITEWNLPIISGVKFKPLLGLKFPTRLLTVLSQLNVLRQSSPDLFNLISEIKVVSVNDIEYELLFYPVGYNMSVNIGDKINEGLLKSTLLVLDVLDHQGMAEKIRALDFRTGEVVYKMEEE